MTFLIALSLVWKRPVSRLRQPIERLKERLRSDRPLENERGDLLGFAPVVEALANLVRSSDTSLPIVIAVNGAFGTGKSSIAKMVAERLRKHELKIVWFDAWHHQSESDLLASLFESVRQSIGLEELGFRLNLIRIRAGMNIVIALATSLVLVWCSRLFGVRETITRALAIAPVAYAAIQSSAVFGLLRPIAATFRLPILDAPLGLRQRFHKALGEVTKALGRRRLVIVIDDLDRADDDGRRTVLNAINFITAAADCAFILSMNRTEMKDYATLLEKIVDLNIGVPVMQADHMKHLLCDEAQPVFYWGAIRQHVRLDWGAIWRHDRHNWKAIWGHVRHDMRAIRRQLQQVLEAIRRDVQPIAEAMWRHIRHVVAPLAIVTIISVVVWAFTATLGGGGPETRWPSTARGETTATANPATTAPATTHEEAAAAPPTSPTRAAIHHIGQWPTAVFIVLGAAPVLLIILMLVRPGTPPVHDSPAFTAALEFWSDVIYAGHTTPRAVKRFANRARFYALYRAAERPTETTELSERTIVAAVANDEIDHRDDAVEKALVKHASLGSIDLRAEIAALQALRVYWRGDVEDDRDTN
ncbi:MAG TPA: P-loop NTPase fold protein [Thermoanaerobaculia bacterium]|nr:P-loop NTPase fold protein [Thermoanaerobaculia bacterium]